MKYLLIITLGLGALIACAPKTTEAISESSNETATTESSEVLSDADVTAGKEVFKENCISCHYGRDANRIPEVVDRLDQEQWDEILPEMIEKAELDETQIRQVTAYIEWEIAN
jgi:mono/diheme cytochrome c family protein